MHERKLSRLTGFDYSLSRYYFITICVERHVHTFGSIENGAMHLTENGIIADEQWKWLKDHFHYIDLISYIVMPDHVHAIVLINTDFYNENLGNDQNINVGDGLNGNLGNGQFENLGNGQFENLGNGQFENLGNGQFENLGNGRDRSLQSDRQNPEIQTIPKIKPLPELIGAYKTTVSKRIHLHGDVTFKWQKSFHDHIIRNDRSLYRIINYIETNPSRW
jgi:putative transposase